MAVLLQVVRFANFKPYSVYEETIYFRNNDDVGPPPIMTSHSTTQSIHAYPVPSVWAKLAFVIFVCGRCPAASR
jgi:hypothetical protein